MSFPAYESYKESGVEWLGRVPSHWTLEKLKHLATFSGGGTPSRERPEYWGGGIPWVSPKDMKAPFIDNAEETISEAGLANSATNLVSPGAVLMVVRSGILKHTVPVAENRRAVALNQDMKAIRFGERCSGRFFRYWVEGLNDALVLAWSKQGATVESIEHAYLAESTFPLPPRAEQAEIAAFLDRETAKIDALVEAQERLIALLKEKRQAVISHAVTKGLDPSAPTKDSGVEWLGQVPAHWEVVRLAQLFREIAEPGNDDLPVLSVSIHTGVSDGEIDPDDADRKITRSEDRSKYKSVRSGDLVYNMMRAWQGGFGTVTTVGAVSPAYVVARPSGDLETQFVELLLRTPQAVEEMRARSRGITDFRLRLYWEQFREIVIAVPTEEERRAILGFVLDEARKMDALASQAQAAITLLLERRAALISAAVTGKIDVRGLVQTAEAA